MNLNMPELTNYMHSFSEMFDEHAMRNLEIWTQDKFTLYYNHLVNTRNSHPFSEYTDLELILMVVIILISICYIWHKVSEYLDLTLRRGKLRLLYKVPIVGPIVKFVCGLSVIDFAKALPTTNYRPLLAIPDKGWNTKDIIARQDEYQQVENKEREQPKLSGVQFTDRKELHYLAQEGARRFLYTNCIYYAKTAPSRQMENEMIQFVRDLQRGSPSTSGLVTTGGSESIFLGVLAHKRYFFKERGIDKPEIILCETAHIAFRKACEYLSIKMTILPLNKKTLTLYAEQFEKAITPNTILMVVSCPNFPYGIVDPIEEVSVLARQYKTGLFVDGCMGSLQLPFVKTFNVDTGEEHTDLMIKGVTAFTCDTHKYGLTPKGTSVILFPNKEIQKAIYYGVTDWLGGIYGTPMIAGSRASAMIAGSWAVMIKMGREGYAQHAKSIFEATDEIVEGVQNTWLKDYIKVVGKPKLGNVVFISNNSKCDMYKLSTIMAKRGYYFGTGVGIKSLMFTITDKNHNMMQNMLNDFKECIFQLLEKNGNIKNEGIVKTIEEVKFYPAWITDVVVGNAIQEMYDPKWLFKGENRGKSNEQIMKNLENGIGDYYHVKELECEVEKNQG